MGEGFRAGNGGARHLLGEGESLAQRRSSCASCHAATPLRMPDPDPAPAPLPCLQTRAAGCLERRARTRAKGRAYKYHLTPQLSCAAWGGRAAR